MTRKLLMIVMAALILPWLVSTASAAMLSGKITKIDPSAKTLTVDDGKAPLNFSLSSNATVMDGKKAIGLDTLRVGDPVRVNYTDQGGSHTANAIHKQHALPEKPAAAKPAAPAKPHKNAAPKDKNY